MDSPAARYWVRALSMEKSHSAEPFRAAVETPSPERVKAEERSWSAVLSASEREAPLLGVALTKEVESRPVSVSYTHLTLPTKRIV